MAKDTITPETLRGLLGYDPATGALTWRSRPTAMFSDGAQAAEHNAAAWNNRNAGKLAFTATSRGYKIGQIFGQCLKAHRVAWAIHHGAWPAGQIDHINHDRADNRIENLREVSQDENKRNARRAATNTSGVTGVSWHEPTGKWIARIWEDGTPKHLGLFASFEDAVQARRDAELRLGYHPNHGLLACG